MVTSRMSYSLHCDIGGHMVPKERVVPIHEFSRLHVENEDMPTLYVAMATWIPKCNMYNVDSDSGPEKNTTEQENRSLQETLLDKIPLENTPADNIIEEITQKGSQENEDNEKNSPVEEISENVSQENDKIQESGATEKCKLDDNVQEETKKKSQEIKENEKNLPLVEIPEGEAQKDLQENDENTIKLQEPSKLTDEESQKNEDDENRMSVDDIPESKSQETSDVELESDSELNTTQEPDKSLDQNTSSSDLTPKKGIKKSLSSRKKLPENIEKARAEREKKRLEAKESKEKLKQEKIQQKIKEKQEKEEQRKKEKLEKEEQKRKEREEKEEIKRKERDQKEEQKKKEREEKEEQKRKEREEKELKSKQQLEKDKKKFEKESAAFVNFFVPRKSTGIEKKTEEKTIENSSFMPFEVKADMRLAPTTRTNLTKDQNKNLTRKLQDQNETVLYLTELKNGKRIAKSSKTWPVEDNDVIIIEDTDIGECVEEQARIKKMRAKFLKFRENRRPAYFGTWRKRSKFVRPRNPLGLDKLFDYDVDSDDEWEEEEPGESLQGSDDEEKEMSDEYEVDNEFFVPHGYLSDEEAENEENLPLTPETQKEKLKILQMEFEQEMKSKTERIKPRLIGCIWESKLKPKIQDAINTFLEERMMIFSSPVIITKVEPKSVKNIKTNTPGRKILSKEHIPEFLKLVHGSTNSRLILVTEFLNYLNLNNIEGQVSKAGLSFQLKELAKWKKCPEEGVMFKKHCWYVSEDVRKQYNLNLELPNKWNFTTNDEPAMKKKLNL